MALLMYLNKKRVLICDFPIYVQPTKLCLKQRTLLVVTRLLLILVGLAH